MPLTSMCRAGDCTRCPGCDHDCHPVGVEQPSLFDEAQPPPPTIKQARDARDKAMSQADDNADAAWRVKARAMLLRFATDGDEFSTDDLWDAGLPKPREPRALGPIINAAKRQGVIVDTGKMRQSRYRHATKITVWRGV